MVATEDVQSSTPYTILSLSGQKAYSATDPDNERPFDPLADVDGTLTISIYEAKLCLDAFDR